MAVASSVQTFALLAADTRQRLRNCPSRRRRSRLAEGSLQGTGLLRMVGAEVEEELEPETELELEVSSSSSGSSSGSSSRRRSRKHRTSLAPDLTNRSDCDSCCPRRGGSDQSRRGGRRGAMHRTVLGASVGDELRIKIYYGYTTYQLCTLPALRVETMETTMKCGPLGAPAPAARNPARK